MSRRNTNLKVIILAAGYAKRMRPLSDTTHKTLLKIGERTVLQRIIDALLFYSLSMDITIVTGYRAEEIQAHMGQSFPQLKVNYIHNPKYAETNNIHSLALAFEVMSIDKDILLIESDLIFEPSILEPLFSTPHCNIALVDRYRSGMDGTVVTVDAQQDVITDIIPPHRQGTDFDFKDKYKTLNIYRFSGEFCRGSFGKFLNYYSATIDNNCYYELILGLIVYAQKGEIVASKIPGDSKWAEIDDPNDLHIAEFIFDKPSQKKILDNAFGGYWNYDIVDYCFLRNFYFPTPAVLSELKNSLIPLLHNYGSRQNILNEKLATYLLCQREHVTVLNGLAQIYPVLEQYFCDFKALLPAPSFGEYSRIFPTALAYPDAVGIDPATITELAKDADLVVFVNPNNPTGTTLPTEWIYEFAASRPDKKIILDESFIDFADEPSILAQLEQKPLPNLLLLTSLSKTLGIPGMRLGYAYSSDLKFNAYLHRRVPIWNLNSLAEHFLEIILKHRDAIAKSFQKTKDEKERFACKLRALDRVEEVYPSGGNFFLVSLNGSSDLPEKLLSEHNIYVKDLSDKFKGSLSYWRVAVRNRADNQLFLKALAEI